MARRRNEHRRLDLARRACEVLAREGLAISAEELALALGVKRPLLLYYFPTYLDIVQTLLGDVIVEQSEFVRSRVVRETHPIRQLYVRVCATHEFHAGREELLFLTQALAALGGTRVADLLRSAGSAFEAERATMVARIEDGVRSGIVEPCDAHAIVALARSTVDGLLVHRLVGGHDADAVHALLWNSVLKPLLRAPDAKASTVR